jgi:hypothetical protein
MLDCIRSMGRSLRDIWPLSLCRRKPITFAADIETGLQHSFGAAEVVLSPVVFNHSAKFGCKELVHKTGDVDLPSHRSNPSHRTVITFYSTRLNSKFLARRFTVAN